MECLGNPHPSNKSLEIIYNFQFLIWWKQTFIYDIFKQYIIDEDQLVNRGGPDHREKIKHKGGPAGHTSVVESYQFLNSRL